MRFKKISVTKKGVHLIRETKSESGAAETIDLDSPERPLASFSDALQSLVPYVTELLDIPKAWQDKLTVTTVNLSEDQNGLLGLIVTVTRPVKKAYDKPLVMNTPLVREGGELALAEAFVLSDEVLGIVALIQSEATRYAKGERIKVADEDDEEEQSSETTKAFNDSAAAAEAATTRTPHSQKGKGKGKGKGKRKGVDFIPGVGDVVNPEATVAPEDEVLRKLVLAAGRDVPVDAIARWASSDRDAAQAWAENGGAGEPPECVARDGTLPLLDTWADAAPPRISDDDVQEIRAAQEAGVHMAAD